MLFSLQDQTDTVSFTRIQNNLRFRFRIGVECPQYTLFMYLPGSSWTSGRRATPQSGKETGHGRPDCVDQTPEQNSQPPGRDPIIGAKIYQSLGIDCRIRGAMKPRSSLTVTATTQMDLVLPFHMLPDPSGGSTQDPTGVNPQPMAVDASAPFRV